MSNSLEIRDRAIQISRQACQEDRNQNYEEAYGLYKQAIQYFMHLRKCKFYSVEKNPNLKQNYEQKADEYMTRAEEIQQYLQGQNKRAVITNGNEERKNKARGEDDNEDNNSELKKSLESAIVTEKPNVRWDDVAGLENAKQALQEAVILPTRFPELFQGKRTPWKGILLYGPPGTGKSYLAKACATEADAMFFSVSSSDLVSKYMGESERLVRSLFEMARSSAPSIIFIDEVDSLCGSRSDGENDATRRIKTEFLVQMQGLGTGDANVLVLGATNIPWGLDSAIRRRFEQRIYIALPDLEARLGMFKIHVGDTPNNLTEDDYYQFAESTQGFSGSDINTVVKSALMEPVRRCHKSHFFKTLNIEGKTWYTPCAPSDPGAQSMSIMQVPQNSLKPPDITADDFYKILDTAKPSVSPEDLVKQEEFTNAFGMEG